MQELEAGRERRDEESQGVRVSNLKSEAAGFEDGRRGLEPRNASSQQELGEERRGFSSRGSGGSPVRLTPGF